MAPDNYSFAVSPDDCKLITNYYEWLDAQEIEYDEDAELTGEQEEEEAIVSEILALDGAHWMYRRVSGGVFCQSQAIKIWNMNISMNQ